MEASAVSDQFYFLFAGDYQDDGTEGGMNDYIHVARDLKSAYEQIVALREDHRCINYAHLAAIVPNGTLSWKYDLVRMRVYKEDGLVKEIEGWCEHNGRDLFIMATLGEEMKFTGNQTNETPKP